MDWLFVLVIVGVVLYALSKGGRGGSGGGVLTASGRRYPVLRPDMLEPAGAPIPTVQAKRLFREWMLKIGYLDKEEIADHVEYFADAMRDHEEILKLDIQSEKEMLTESIREEKDMLRELKQGLKKCTDPAARAEIEKEMAGVEQAILRYQGDFSAEAKALADFKADKRAFLVDYINEQVHGHDWKTKV